MRKLKKILAVFIIINVLPICCSIIAITGFNEEAFSAIKYCFIICYASTFALALIYWAIDVITEI